MPEPNIGSVLAEVPIKIWDGEWNASRPYLQSRVSAFSSWLDATIEGIDGTGVGWVSASPTDPCHNLIWNAYEAFGYGFSNSVQLRTRSKDISLGGSGANLYLIW